MNGDRDVWETHERRPQCFDTMVLHMILPQIGLHQEMQWKTLWRETTMFWKPMERDHDVSTPLSKILNYLRLDWPRKCI